MRAIFCGICNPDPNGRPAILQTAHPECLAKVEPISEEELRGAIEQGERDRAAVAAGEGSWVESGVRFR